MIEAKVLGIPDLRRELSQIVPKLRYRALRNALAAGAREVRDAARRAAPVINVSSYQVRKGYRKPGTVRKAISVRTSKVARRSGDVGVFVNVKPAKSGMRGAKNPNDPFYWRWLQFGSKDIRPFKILESGAEKLPQALEIFKQKLPGIIAKLNRPKAPPP